MKLPNPFVDFEPEFTGPGSASAEIGSRKKWKGGSVGVSWSASGKVRWPDGKMIEGRIKTRIIVDEKGKAVGRETVFKPFAGQTDASENAIPTETVVLSKDDHVETYSTKVVEALRRGNRSASKDGEEAPDASRIAPNVKGRGERTAGRAAAATANARGGGGANMNTVPAMKPLEEASFPEMKSKVQDDTDDGAERGRFYDYSSVFNFVLHGIVVVRGTDKTPSWNAGDDSLDYLWLEVPYDPAKNVVIKRTSTVSGTDLDNYEPVRIRWNGVQVQNSDYHLDVF